MTLLEKTKASKDKSKFTLYKEGIFFKCYNEDAMLFSQRIMKYKISVRFVKSVDSEVLSLGFPVSESVKGRLSLIEIGKLLGGTEFEEHNKCIVYHMKENLKEDYSTWSKQIILNKKAKGTEISSLKEKQDISDLILMIRNFDLANSTPMQGLNFIQDLKTVIQKLD